LDYINYPIAEIGITVPSSRINISEMDNYGKIIKGIAMRLSHKLNCQLKAQIRINISRTEDVGGFVRTIRVSVIGQHPFGRFAC
jgi:S-adenosylmethionine hydrolase